MKYNIQPKKNVKKLSSALYDYNKIDKDYFLLGVSNAIEEILYPDDEVKIDSVDENNFGGNNNQNNGRQNNNGNDESYFVLQEEGIISRSQLLEEYSSIYSPLVATKEFRWLENFKDVL